MYLWIKCSIFFIFLLNSPIALATDPSEQWKTLVSDHFEVHYLDAYSSQAKRAAFIAEQQYTELQSDFSWTPKERISMVITDEFDQANGSATPLPFNKVILRLTPPDKVGQLDDYDDWLALLIEHELTHIFHMDKASGKVMGLRNIFGRYILLFPNVFQPSWFLEGLATDKETHQGIGRGQSSSFEMLMREEVNKGLLAVNTVNLPADSQPLGRHYLYGVYFYQFLRDTYGEESIKRLVENYSNNLLPFSINSNSKSVFGKDISELWQEFSVYLTKHFSIQIDKLKKSGIKKGVVVVNKPHKLSSIDFLDSDAMIYIEDDLESPSQLVKIENSKKYTLTELNSNSYFDIGSDNKVYISQVDYCDEYHIYYDLYRYDLVSGQIKQLTKCSRYKHFSVSKQNNKLVAVKTVYSMPQIDLLDNNGVFVKTLWKGVYGDVISHIDWSEKRNKLLITKKQLNKSWNIYEFDLNTKEWSDVAVDEAIFQQAQYAADEEGILFSSDLSGVYNIYKKPFSSDRYVAITNVVSGAFSPMQHNNKLFYQKFERNGYSILSADLEPSTVLSIKKNKEPVIRFDKNIADLSNNYLIKDYSPWSDLKPKFWFPWLLIQNNASEIGFVTSSNDSLSHHFYQLNLFYGYEQEDLLGLFFYQYTNWLALVLSKENSIYSNNLTGLTDLIRTNQQWQVRLTLPFTKIKERWRFNLGFIDNQEKDTYRAAGVAGFQDQKDGLLGLRALYDSKQSFIKGNSPETGRDVLLVTESSDVFDSDYSGTTTTLDWREYFRLGLHHTLALRYVVGNADQTMRAYKLGGLESDWDNVTIFNPQVVRTLFNKRTYSLRGYAENIQTGNNIELASVEWRFPLLHIEKGIMAPPVGIMKHSARLFTEMGASWTDNQEKKMLRSVGAEWIIDVNIFYRFTPQIRLGYAEGLDDGGDKIFYLKVGGAF